jgi:hypothetical protein
MGQLTRDAGDSMDQTRPATYSSQTGSFRLLPALEIPDGWYIYPELGDFLWLLPGWPGYLAVPQYDKTYGYCYGLAVYRLDRPGSEPVGYAQNLLDMCWPAERDLIATMNARPAEAAA